MADFACNLVPVGPKWSRVSRRDWGSLQRRGNRWTIRYVDPTTGRRTRKTLPASVPARLTDSESDAILAAFRRRLERTGGRTLASFIDHHEPVYRSRVRPGTAACVLYSARKLATELGDLPMRAVDASFAATFLAGLKRTGLGRGAAVSDFTLRQYRNVLRSFWNAAVEAGWADANPWVAVKIARPQERPVPVLVADECARLLAALPPRYRAIAGLMLETGLRKSEAFALVWEDVAGNGVTVRASKTGKPRTVPLTTAARAILEGVPRRRGVGRTNRVFPSRLRPDVLHAACAKAGLPRLRIHDLRHIFAVRCARAGVPLLHLSKILGHSTVAMTQRYADHCPDSMAAEGIGRLESHERSASSAMASGSTG